MRKRVLGVLLGAALAAVPLTASGAAAQTAPGTGTASAVATVLRVQLGTAGSLLDVRLLGDDSTSTNAPGRSSAAISPLTITSTAVPGLALAVPPVQTSTTGTTDSKQLAPALPATPATTGTLTGALSSVVDATSARSTIDATLSNLALAGGLLTVPSAALRIGTDARGTAADATRSLTVPKVVVLDLGAVLDGLGRSLASLPVDALVALLGELGLTLPVGTGTLDAPGLATAIDDLTGAIDEVVALGAGALDETVCGVVDDALGSLPDLPSLPGEPVDCTDVATTAAEVLAELQGVLAGLLSSLLSLLDGAALLTVTDLNVGVTTKATNAVGTSVADVTAKLGSVQVGALALPGLSGLDLAAGVGAINGLAGTVGTAVGGVLAAVDPSLAGIVKVDLLQVTKQVRTEGKDVVAQAGVVGLRATITPPAGLVAAAVDTSNTGATITALGGTVPALTTALEGALGGVQALSGPSTVTVADLGSTARFAPGAAAIAAPPTRPASQTLPRTGSDTDRMIEFSAALLVAGLSLLVLVARRRPAAL